MVSRIDIIGQNGGEGEHYLIEQIARAIAGEHADKALRGRYAGQKQWQLHIKQAMAIMEIIEEANRV